MKGTLKMLSRKRQPRALGKPLRQILVLATLVTAVSFPGAGFAQDLGEPRFTLRGFGTLAATTQDTDGIEYRRSVGQPLGVAGGDVELYTDSIAGVQVDARLNTRFDVMAQGVSRLRADGGYDLKLTQGFVRYSLDESLQMRAGRLGYDIYLLAESRQVGYSYLALRPPLEFYGQLTNDEIDGADIAYARRVGPGLARARVFGGGTTSETAFVDGTYTKLDADVYGATFDYLYQGWTARVALLRFQYDADPRFAPLIAGLNTTGVPKAVAMAGQLDHRVLSTSGVQLGVAYDDGPLQAQLLYGIVKSESVAGPNFKNLYTLFGYRLRSFTPFASFASSRDRAPPRSTGLPALPMFEPLNGAVAAIQTPLRTTQHTASVGIRYDLSSHVDLKVQIDRVNLRDSAMIFDRRTPTDGRADFTVAAVAIDFVF